MGKPAKLMYHDKEKGIKVIANSQVIANSRGLPDGYSVQFGSLDSFYVSRGHLYDLTAVENGIRRFRSMLDQITRYKIGNILEKNNLTNEDMRQAFCETRRAQHKEEAERDREEARELEKKARRARGMPT